MIDYFQADVINGVIAQAVAEVERRAQEVPAARQALQERLATLDRELGNLAAAVAAGQAPQTLLDAIRDREAERRDAQARLEHVEGLSLDPATVDQTLHAAFATLNRDLHSPGARQALQRLLPEPLVIRPAGQDWTFEGVGTLGAEVCGSIPGPMSLDLAKKMAARRREEACPGATRPTRRAE